MKMIQGRTLHALLRRSPFFCCLLMAMLLPAWGHATPEPAQSEILSKAQAMELQDDPYWHVLLHYQKAGKGFTSRVDDPNFFLAPDGKTNPKAELQTAITAFFQPLEQDVIHPVCRFPARFAWIAQKIGPAASAFPIKECPRFEEIYSQIQPDSAVLIFPTAHINSPASMFGHTLLAVETKGQGRLLAHAINYSAVTGPAWGPIYAFQGLFGGYQGYFSMLPYYEKIQEYSDVAHRDMWEYPLNLTKEELRRMLLHLYELDNIHSDYYFLDENCAFNLLYLVDAARPGSDLANQCPYVAVPVDTVRLMQKDGFITNAPAYRPSKMTRVNHLKNGLNRHERALALKIAEGKIDPVAEVAPGASDTKAAQTLDLATEIISYRYTRKVMPVETYTERYRSVLAARSSLGKQEAPPLPEPASPDSGHLSSKIWLGGGTDDGEGFVRLGWRPLFHGFDDNLRGYEKGAQILALNTSLDYFPEKGRVDLHQLDLLDIFSLAPRDDVFKSLSWRIGTGFHQMMEKDGNQGAAYVFNMGGGISKDLGPLGLGYLLAEADFAATPGWDMGYGAGPGLRMGVLAEPAPWWRVRLEAKGTRYALGDSHTALNWSAESTFATSQNTGFHAKALFMDARDFSRTRIDLSFHLYF
ncbi:MAG: DUF4105 domain-containing protein [Desulfatibacillum sp.]|nr:DUF4105 domain-containing protein [Desulfatibacillum sp.]